MSLEGPVKQLQAQVAAKDRTELEALRQKGWAWLNDTSHRPSETRLAFVLQRPEGCDSRPEVSELDQYDAAWKQRIEDVYQPVSSPTDTRHRVYSNHPEWTEEMQNLTPSLTEIAFQAVHCVPDNKWPQAELEDEERRRKILGEPSLTEQQRKFFLQSRVTREGSIGLSMRVGDTDSARDYTAGRAHENRKEIFPGYSEPVYDEQDIAQMKQNMGNLHVSKEAAIKLEPNVSSQRTMQHWQIESGMMPTIGREREEAHIVDASWMQLCEEPETKAERRAKIIAERMAAEAAYDPPSISETQGPPEKMNSITFAGAAPEGFTQKRLLDIDARYTALDSEPKTKVYEFPVSKYGPYGSVNP